MRSKFSNGFRLGASALLGLDMLATRGTGVAWAHAQYGGSTPGANSTISALPNMLQISYSQEVSAIQILVTGPDGSNATTGQATFDLENRHQTSVPVRDAGPGQYTVVWHNVSGDDGDPNDGPSFSTVAAPQGAATKPPSGDPPPSGTTTPTAAAALPAAKRGPEQ